jgi:bacterioferritin
MKGDQRVLAVLNDVLTNELTTVNQYFLAARMLKQWGFERLASYYRKESIDEMKHAERLIDRILFLEGVPNVQKLNKIMIGEKVEEQLKLDLDVEHVAVKRLNDGIIVCRDARDGGSEELLIEILTSEEEHVDWLETQLDLITKLGPQAYLAEQMKD